MEKVEEIFLRALAKNNNSQDRFLWPYTKSIIKRNEGEHHENFGRSLSAI